VPHAARRSSSDIASVMESCGSGVMVARVSPWLRWIANGTR
jgi:hypothetical protein